MDQNILEVENLDEKLSETNGVSEKESETKRSILDDLIDAKNMVEAQPADHFPFSEFERLLVSVTEFQAKACRDINGEMVNSLPIDKEVWLSKFVTWLRKKYEPYEKAKQKFAKGLGFTSDPNTGQISYPNKLKKDASPEQKEAFVKEREEKVVALTDAYTEISNSQFAEYPDLKTRLASSPFTEENIKESGIIFKDCQNKQAFLQYCVKEK